MKAPISSKVVSLGELIGEKETFFVPPYQRNYSWDESEYGVFWDDIAKTFERDTPEYFLGSIVISKEREPEFIVIDGQQRLITISILLAALRAHLLRLGKDTEAHALTHKFLGVTNARGEPQTAKIILNKNDRAFYERHIVWGGNVKEVDRASKDDRMQMSNRLLAKCFCFFYNRLVELLSGGWSVEALSASIREALYERNYVIRLDVRNDIDAFTLFETLNDRGLELSEADLLKSHLLAVSGAEREQVQAAWETVEENLNNERVVKFVRHHWNSTRGLISKRGLYADIKSTVTSPSTARNYASEVCSASEYYAALRDPAHHLWLTFPRQQQQALRQQIEAVGLLRPDQIFIILLAALEADRRNFHDFLTMVVNFTFRYTTICNLGSSRLPQVFIEIARHIRERGEADPAEIFKQYLKSLYPSDDQFRSAFSRKAIRHNGQARYILTKLNDSLETGRIDPLNTDLEHIFPKRFSPDWVQDKKDFPGGPKKYVYRLGNMTLIAPELNQKLGNAPFSVKREAFTSHRLRITDTVVEAKRWTAEEINRRQNWMAELAVKIWRYPLD